MKRAVLLIALILVVESSSMAFAAPMKRKHKPWLMIGGGRPAVEASEPTVEPARAAAPVARRRPEPVKRVHRVARAQEARASKVQADEKGDKVAKQALRYKGTRYKFGGNSKRGIDCSGLVAKVFEDLKLKKIPRASSALFNSGTAVTQKDLRPGDLVFFKNTYRRGISHVGVYTGNNKFVHAANSRRGVTVTPLSDPYFQLHYAGARRIY